MGEHIHSRVEDGIGHLIIDRPARFNSLDVETAQDLRKAGLSLARWEGGDLEAYRALFRAVGQDWLWSSRLMRSDKELGAVLHDPAIETYVLSDGGGEIGLIELDFREPEECELVFLGVIKRAIGSGAGGFLMDRALANVS